MEKKNTDELDKILGSTHPEDINEYLRENADSMREADRPFAGYMRKLIKEKGLKQQDVFISADIPERYGYKLISEEKRTKQRDVILRLCYAAQFSPEETQRALKMYEMPTLYSKIPRDALLMTLFRERPGNIYEINEILEKHHMEPLRSSGTPEE